MVAANVPAGTIVISNAHVVEDVQFYADGGSTLGNGNGSCPILDMDWMEQQP